MVSQPDHSTSLTLRGAQSVVGVSTGHGRDHGGGSGARSSLSRSRRYNRSHAGGASSYVPLNEFPVFTHSGDVEILVAVASGHENRYLLHRHTLTRCSGFFEASTSHEWSRAQALPDPAAAASSSAGHGAAARPSHALTTGAELARIGDDGGSETGVTRPSSAGTPKKRWRYELDRGARGDDVPMLVQKEASAPTSTSLFGGGGGANNTSHSSGSRGHKHSSSGSGHSFFRSVANLSLTHHSAPAPLPPPSQAEQDILRDYDNLFRIMYNYPPILDGINIADAYVQCKSLLTLADQYDALAVVGPRVDHHLLQFQSRLWKQIAKYPISYLRLGYLARSKVIFQEALIHVVGQWPAGERSLRAALPDSVLEIIEDKVDELEETVCRIESRLCRLNLTTRNGERVTPATSYLDWLAVSLFRQWLADNTTPPPPPQQQQAPVAADRRISSSRGGDNGGTRLLTNGGRGGSSSSNGSTSWAAGGGGAHHHVVTTTNMPPASPPLASLGRTYRTLGAAHSAAYLGHDECKRFLKLSADLYSRDNLRRFEKRIDELKAMAREIVRPLMGSGLELDLGGGGRGAENISYLTCTSVRDRDLPWED